MPPRCLAREAPTEGHALAIFAGVPRRLPGLALPFPALLQGFHPTKWGELTTTLDGPEVQIFKQACVDNGGWLQRGCRMHQAARWGVFQHMCAVVD